MNLNSDCKPLFWGFFSKQEVLISILATVVWSLFLFEFGSPHMTLNTGLRDNISNLYSTEIFFDHGFDVYRFPMTKFITEGDAQQFAQFDKQTGLGSLDIGTYVHQDKPRLVSVVWPHAPRPYPPGLFLEFALPTLMFEQGWLSPRAAINSLTVFWILISHFCFFTVLRALRSFLPNQTFSLRESSTRIDIFLASLLAVFTYFEFMRWSMNGQYDITALFVLLFSLIALKNSRYIAAFCLYTFAVFIHFRSLFYLPVFFFALIPFLYANGLHGLKKLGAKKWLVVAIAAATGLLALYAFILTYPYLSNTTYFNNNDARFEKLGLNNLGKGLPILFGLATTSFYFWRKRFFLPLVCSLWTAIMLLRMPYVREWYALFFYALLLTLPASKEKKTNRATLLIALIYIVVMSSVFTGNSPFEFRFPKEIIARFSK